MKKAVLLLLLLSLCLSFCACGKGTGNTDIDYVADLLERGEYDMAIEVIEMLRDREKGTGTPGQKAVTPATTMKRTGNGSMSVSYADMNGLSVEVLYDDPADRLEFGVEEASSASLCPVW